jgi:hypothetical protein
MLVAVVFLGAGLFGMLGLSGAVVYVPLLSWWGFNFKTGALPLSLLLGSATALSAAVAYFRAGYVHLRISGATILTAVLGAPLGARAIRIVPTQTLKLLFAIVVIFVAYRILRGKEPEVGRPLKASTATVAGLCLGLIIGFASGLLGVGGGFIMLPTLMHFGFPTKEAVATSSAVVGFSTLSGFLSHLPTAELDPLLATVLTVSVVVGSGLGGIWASKVAKPATLRLMAGILLSIIAIRLFAEALAGII